MKRSILSIIIATVVFGSLAFTSPEKEAKEIKLEKKFKKDSWVSELQINRKENRFTKIEYHYKNKGFSKVISIYKESGQLVISNTEEIK